MKKKKNKYKSCLFLTSKDISVSVKTPLTTNQFYGVRLLAILTGMLRKRITDNLWLLHACYLSLTCFLSIYCTSFAFAFPN